jgi:phage terminase small subunit
MNVHDRIRANPPKSVVSMEEHEQYWSLLADVTDNGVTLDYQDRVALGELAVSLCEMNRLRQDLKDRGESIEVQGDRNVVTKKNPSRDALEKLRPSVLRLMKEFKMTPNSRGAKTYGPTSGDTSDGFDDV